MQTWRYLPFSINTGAKNMAIDEAILQSMAQAPGARPTLRFYGWEPAALSLGYAQNFGKEVDEEACRAAGIDVVRRPTGGRAVLHQYELTYSVIAPEADEHVNGTVIESYLKISQALLHGLRAVGIPAEMTEGQLAGAATAACFDAPSWYELAVDGKKIVGSAQVRKDGVLLQHGSIILHLDAGLLFRVLKFPNEKVRERQLASFSKKAAALDEICSRPVLREELIEALHRGFEKVMAIDLQEGRELSGQEGEYMESLLRKYQSDEWTRKR